MAENKDFDPRAYLTGRVSLPPFIAGKKSRPFGFTGRQTIGSATTGTIPIQIHDDAYFLVEQIQIKSSLQTTAGDAATAQIIDTTSSTQWSNVAVPIRDMGGLGASPKFLLDPNILRPASTLQVQVTNNTGGSATFYILLMGRKIYGLTKPEVDFLTRRLWFQYVLQLPALTAGSTNLETKLNIYNESDFLVKRLLSQQLVNAIIGATAGAESSEVLIQLRDSVSDVNLFDQQVSASLLFGMIQGAVPTAAANFSYAEPFTLKKPWLLRRNGQVVATTTNLASTTIAASSLVFEGIRTFDPV